MRSPISSRLLTYLLMTVIVVITFVSIRRDSALTASTPPHSNRNRRQTQLILKSSETVGGKGGEEEEEDTTEVDHFVRRNLLKPEVEKGKIAICAAVFQEGRFITEWLLYNRLIGVDTFYLYDTGCTDDTLKMLAPWMESGVVKLHQYEQDQGINFQISSLRHCSSTYASATTWLLDADVDEFYVPTRAFTGQSTLSNPTIYHCPIRPLAELLANFMYESADVIAVSRVTFKNQGIQRLSNGSSVLRSQTLRDVYHSIEWPKLRFTKSMIHTRKKEGWVLPWAHAVKHLTLTPSQVKIINVVGERVKDLVMNDEEAVTPGTYFDGKFPTRAFEPLVMYHYVQRDMDNCLTKLARASIVRHGGWRDLAGAEGCKDYEMYQESVKPMEVFETNSFYGASTQDYLIADSCYGRHLPTMMKVMNGIVDEFEKSHKVVKPILVKGVPAEIKYPPSERNPAKVKEKAEEEVVVVPMS